MGIASHRNQSRANEVMSRKSLLIFKYRLFYCSASLNLVINQGTLRGLRAVLSSAFGGRAA